MTDNPVWRWIDYTFLDLGRQFRWSYLPPLMVYLAAGVSGLTSIVGTFFIKEYLDLSAAFLASLAFWAGIPWTLKMPLGHLVDLIWRRKAILVYIGASLIALSILIMYAIIAHTEMMAEIMKVEAWFVIATLLAPTGYVVQDVVADAMTVEAVPTIDEHGNPYPDSEIKVMHTTMQTLGRVAIIGGLVAVAALNITMFEGVGNMSEEMKFSIYADIYLLALIIPSKVTTMKESTRCCSHLPGNHIRTGGYSAAASSLPHSRSLWVSARCHWRRKSSSWDRLALLYS
jgi:hypothetical protein